MYVSIASGRGTCGDCNTLIAKGEKQLEVTKSIAGGYNKVTRYCNKHGVERLMNALNAIGELVSK